jgi:hypothetical protein
MLLRLLSNNISKRCSKGRIVNPAQPDAKILTIWRLGAVVCLLFSAAVAIPMWRLWHGREYRLYDGKSVTEKRQALFAHIGMDKYLLRDTDAIRGQLSGPAYYRLSGDGIRLSYVQYLLIPAIPHEDSAWTVVDTGSSLQLAGNGDTRDETVVVVHDETSSSSALIKALFLTGGLAAGLLCVWPGIGGVSAAFLLGCSVVMGLSVLSKGLCGTAVPGFTAVAGLGLAGWCCALVRILRRRACVAVAGLWRRSEMLNRRSLLCCLPVLVLCLVYLGWAFAMAVIVVPDDWDAWAMWGAKAKVLALGSGPLLDVTRFGTADYPLMWPALWAFTGWCGGGWEEVWAKGWGAVLLGLAALELARLRGGLAGALLICMPGVALFASWAYAEPMLWLAMACTFSGICKLSDAPGVRSAVLAGICMATLMYTKNEGIVVWLIACCWLLMNSKIEWKWRLTAMVLPALIYAPWYIWTRLLLRLETHTTGGFLSAGATLTRMSDVIIPSVGAVIRIMCDVRLWGLTGFLLFLIWLWRLFFGNARRRSAALLIAVLAGAYLAVILVGRNDPLWQIGVAWNRLAVHLMIAVFFCLAPDMKTATGADRT